MVWIAVVAAFAAAPGASASIAAAVAPTAAAPEDVTLRIKNPPGAILVRQSYTLEAEGTPPGGTYAWRVVAGADKVTPTTGSGATFTITGTAASGQVDDVRVQVSYKGKEERCNLTVVEIKLKSVTFGGTGYRVITRDDGQGPYATQHWLDHDGDGAATNTTGDHRFPALYERHTRVTVTRLTATVAPNGFARAAVDVQGGGSDNHAFSGQGAIDRGTLTVSANMVADRALRNTIWFYDTYDIGWRVALVQNAFRPIGLSDNRIYVSLERPAIATIYESVAHLACASATGVNDSGPALASMWSEFTDRDVRRKPIDGFNRRDGVRMGYWRPPATICQTLPQMLRSPTGNGACGAWAELLIEMTRVHGVRHPDSRTTVITARPTAVPAAPPDGFLVKRWAFRHAFVHTGANGLNDSDRAPDDNDFVRKGNGFPFTVCITAGTNGRIDTTPANDDQVFGAMIHTGRDGVCDTRPTPDDVPVIPQGRGAPNMPCILAGPNDRIDSTVNPDDGSTVTPAGKPPYPFVMGGSAINLPGIAGQDNPEPPAFFGNHYIVFAFNKFYDPSYGAGPFDTEQAHENAACDGLKRQSLCRRANQNAAELLYTRQ